MKDVTRSAAEDLEGGSTYSSHHASEPAGYLKPKAAWRLAFWLEEVESHRTSMQLRGHPCFGRRLVNQASFSQRN